MQNIEFYVAYSKTGTNCFIACNKVFSWSSVKPQVGDKIQLDGLDFTVSKPRQGKSLRDGVKLLTNEIKSNSNPNTVLAFFQMLRNKGWNVENEPAFIAKHNIKVAVAAPVPVAPVADAGTQLINNESQINTDNVNKQAKEVLVDRQPRFGRRPETSKNSGEDEATDMSLNQEQQANKLFEQYEAKRTTKTAATNTDKKVGGLSDRQEWIMEYLKWAFQASPNLQVIVADIQSYLRNDKQIKLSPSDIKATLRSLMKKNMIATTEPDSIITAVN